MLTLSEILPWINGFKYIHNSQLYSCITALLWITLQSIITLYFNKSVRVVTSERWYASLSSVNVRPQKCHQGIENFACRNITREGIVRPQRLHVDRAYIGI